MTCCREKSFPVPPGSTCNDRRRPCEQVWDLWGQLGLGCSLLLHSHFRCISQVHQRLPLWALLKVLAADTLTDGRAHDLRLRVKTGEVYKCNQWFAFWSDKAPLKQLPKTHLVALAVVLQAARPFAVAAFAVSPVRFALFAFSNFRFEGLWVPVQTSLWKTHYLDSSVEQEVGAIKQPMNPPHLTFIALRRSVSCSRLLKQLLQLQLLQNSPFAKQSQYLWKETEPYLTMQSVVAANIQIDNKCFVWTQLYSLYVWSGFVSNKCTTWDVNEFKSVILTAWDTAT